MYQGEPPPVVAIIGRKNSGKTTLIVALATELKRRGYRVASMKHGHHEFEIDHPGRDSWRHFHEGEVEAVLLVSGARLALVERHTDGEPDPEALIRRFFAGRGYDLVLVEGYKNGPFPMIEVFRSGLHDQPLLIESSRGGSGGAPALALVTDRSYELRELSVIPYDPVGTHVDSVADLLERGLRPRSIS